MQRRRPLEASNVHESMRNNLPKLFPALVRVSGDHQILMLAPVVWPICQTTGVNPEAEVRSEVFCWAIRNGRFFSLNPATGLTPNDI